MANRLLYSSQALFASPISGSTLSQLHRVLSINHGASVTRQDVTVFGSRAPIDRIIVDPPTVSMDISYLVTNGHNEKALGLFVNPTGTAYGSNPGGQVLLTNILNGTYDEQNFFIKVVGEAQDADVDATDPVGVIGVGNASLGSYSLEARVGGFPTASARLAGLNIEYTMGSATVDNPSISSLDGSPFGSCCYATYVIPNAPTASLNDPINAIRPGDISLDLPSLFALDNGTICPQSFTLSVDLNREALRCLGSKFRYANEINFPLTATFSIEVLVRDLKAARLADVLCSDADLPDTFDIKLRSPNCTNGVPGASTDANNLLVYSMRGARFDGITFNNGVGNGETATLNYSISIGSPRDVLHNIFVVSEVGGI